jgi:putative tricarboxylic transport membrane protein
VDILGGLLTGFQVCLQPLNLLYCFLGCFFGTLIGVLPGIGPAGALAMLLPLTLGISPASAIIMLAGIYYGVMYGGSTTAILVNIPGEPASIVTMIDGHQMARRGRAGVALGIAALGSFIGGTLSVVMLTVLTVPLAELGIKFGPPEFFSIIFMSLALLMLMSRGSIFKVFVMALIGLIVSTVGLDLTTGIPRFTFNIPALHDGVGIVPIAMGLFGIAEVLQNIENQSKTSLLEGKIERLLPNLQDWKRSIGPILRGTFIGFFLGLIPGVGGGMTGPLISYSVEKKISKKSEFGQGAIEGVAGPETANNASTGAAFVPLLALGIPGNVVIAILFGALILHGVAPGPLLISEHPDVFWGVIASMYTGNVMLLILNLPLIGIWVRIIKIPNRILMPLILLFCLIGSYSLNNSAVDLVIMIIFGIFGYAMRKLDYDLVPLIMGFILGPLIETSFRQSLLLSDGKFHIFFVRPISATFLFLSGAILFVSALSEYRKGRRKLLGT